MLNDQTHYRLRTKQAYYMLYDKTHYRLRTRQAYYICYMTRHTTDQGSDKPTTYVI